MDNIPKYTYKEQNNLLLQQVDLYRKEIQRQDKQIMKLQTLRDALAGILIVIAMLFLANLLFWTQL